MSPTLTKPSLVFLLLSQACAPAEPTSASVTGSAPEHTGVSGEATASTRDPAKEITVSVLGTNDLHGHASALPVLAGYVENLRAVRGKTGGGVLLVDAGDMFQGTLESNLLEGKPVRDAYAALGYAAVAVGNHEFDYGPTGPSATPQSPSDDPRGALKALAKDAPFPFLLANVLDKATHARVDYPNMPASVLVEVAGVSIGIVGVTTKKTLETTISTNVSDFEIAPLDKTIVSEASALRKRGARAVIALAHAGGKCRTFTNDVAADHCDEGEEIFRVVKALPPGTVDVVVAGHTHAGVAHEVAGTVVIEQFAYGRALGRVDLVFSGTGGPIKRTIFPPRDLCAGSERPDFATCDPGSYEGAKVARVAKVEDAIAPGLAIAKDKRDSKVGVELEEVFKKDYHSESPLGNLYAQMILEGARTLPSRGDVALMNGGGLRQDLPGGDLRYGAFFESFPFDNRMATATIRVGQLKHLLAAHLRAGSGGILSVAGVRVSAHCKGSDLVIDLASDGAKRRKKRLDDSDSITLVASDFMLLGGDDFWGDIEPPKVSLFDDLVRDVIEKAMHDRKKIAPADVFDKKAPRLDAPGRRPIRCK